MLDVGSVCLSNTWKGADSMLPERLNCQSYCDSEASRSGHEGQVGCTRDDFGGYDDNVISKDC